MFRGVFRGSKAAPPKFRKKEGEKTGEKGIREGNIEKILFFKIQRRCLNESNSKLIIIDIRFHHFVYCLGLISYLISYFKW